MEWLPNPDWVGGRAPLPILFAMVVDHPDRERFLQLRTNILEEENLIAAQEILVRCGAISSGVDQILRRYQAAIKIMRGSGLAQPQVLAEFLDKALQPVRALLRGPD
jgi:hypothetical protein